MNNHLILIQPSLHSKSDLMGNKGTIVTKTLEKLLCDSEHINNKIILKSVTYVDIKSDGIFSFSNSRLGKNKQVFSINQSTLWFWISRWKLFFWCFFLHWVKMKTVIPKMIDKVDRMAWIPPLHPVVVHMQITSLPL